MEVKEVAYHRNGTSGEPFYVVSFTDDGENMIGIVFLQYEQEEDAQGNQVIKRRGINPRVAVMSMDKLPVIAFGFNSYRGDQYADAMFDVIEEHERNQR